MKKLIIELKNMNISLLLNGFLNILDYFFNIIICDYFSLYSICIRKINNSIL